MPSTGQRLGMMQAAVRASNTAGEGVTKAGEITLTSDDPDTPGTQSTARRDSSLDSIMEDAYNPENADGQPTLADTRLQQLSMDVELERELNELGIDTNFLDPNHCFNGVSGCALLLHNTLLPKMEEIHLLIHAITSVAA